VSNPEPRVFLDANVIFSGLYSSHGTPGTILKYLVEGRIKAVISQQVLEEVIRNIKEKLPEALPVLKGLLENVPLEIVADPSLEEISCWVNLIHPADAAILAAAIVAKPDYFLTGDNHFLGNPELINKSTLKIVTTANFLKLFKL
jgi:putative PIN family toxin of toxin-antitoxin system